MHLRTVEEMLCSNAHVVRSSQGEDFDVGHILHVAPGDHGHHSRGGVECRPRLRFVVFIALVKIFARRSQCKEFTVKQEGSYEWGLCQLEP